MRCALVTGVQTCALPISFGPGAAASLPGMVERWLPEHPTPEEEPAVRDTPRPTPTRDLDDESEIAEMVRRFYADVAQDDLLGPMFNDVAQVDWSEHLPKLTAFWSRALLGRSGYAGNPFRAHALVPGQRSGEHTSELQS